MNSRIIIRGENPEQLDLAKELLAEIETASEKAGFSYLNAEIEFRNNEISIGFCKNVNGVSCHGKVHTGCRMNGDKPAVEISRLAAIAVARQSEWFARMEEEAREDVAVRDGGKPWLKPNERTTLPGHWISPTLSGVLQ